MPKILIADDHGVVRRGIMQILQEAFSELYMEEASDTDSLVQKALGSDWDIIITDLSMPGGGGIYAIDKIREVKPRQSLLVMSINTEIQYAVRVFSGGASGFLNKDAAVDELVSAVQTILSGRRFIQPSLADRMTKAMRNQAGILPHELLSEKEYNVMLKLAAAIPEAEIARQLTLSEKLMSDYRNRIMEMIGVQSNTGLVQYVSENGLV